jgi:hypothetical protein
MPVSTINTASLASNAVAPFATSLSTIVGSAPSYACRAWVNFNGFNTPTIIGSGNVSSITDLGVGTYYVNFATAMPDTNYCVASTRNWRGLCNSDEWNTGSVLVLTADTSSNTPSDSFRNFVSIFR